MEEREKIRRLAFLGLMTALVFVGNYARVMLPVPVGGIPSFTLANILCVLSGLLFGPVGGVASGLGSALYDLTNPAWAAECWITFLTKGAMGLMAGMVVTLGRKGHRDQEASYWRCLAGAAAGCAAYYVLYYLKNFFYSGILVGGLQPAAAAATLVTLIPTSLFNGGLAILVVPPPGPGRPAGPDTQRPDPPQSLMAPTAPARHCRAGAFCRKRSEILGFPLRKGEVCTILKQDFRSLKADPARDGGPAPPLPAAAGLRRRRGPHERRRERDMHFGKRIRILILAGALSLALAAPALAAGYTDLSGSHWAYDTLTKAADLGILQGLGDGRMDPSGTLSWGQFLAMFTRTFASRSYDNALDAGLSWDQAGLQAALSGGLLLPEDGLAVTGGGSLGDPVARQDAALLLARVLPEGAEATHSIWDLWNGTMQSPVDASALTDWSQMDEAHQAAVAALAQAGVVQGRADGSFGYADTLQRADGATLLVRVLDKVDQAHSGEEKAVTFRFVDRTTGQTILPDQKATAMVGQSVSSAADTSGVGYYYEVTPLLQHQHRLRYLHPPL